MTPKEEEKLRKRINHLYHKKQAEGLSKEEEQERKELHQKFIANFRAGFRQQLDNLVVVDKEGNDITPDKAKQIQKERGIR